MTHPTWRTQAAWLAQQALPSHGGPDAAGPAPHDFSTNANPLPLPVGLQQALAQADRRHYPDPGYHALRQQLAQAWGVVPERLLPTAGSSEAIQRLSLLARLHGRRSVWVPEPGYGDYRSAAQALGLRVHGWRSADELLQRLPEDGGTALVWLTEPNNPDGSSLPATFWPQLAELAERQGCWLALDRAYEPLRLRGHDSVPAAVAARCWQALSPNKALGLTGVRAGMLLAPEPGSVRGVTQQVAQLLSLAPSWVMGADGVAMLQAYTGAEVQTWLAAARATLRQWQAEQRQLLAELGWQQRDSVTPFWLVRPPVPAADLPRRLARLRSAGVQLRDAQSFGLPGWLRVSTQPPAARQALQQAWAELGPLPAAAEAALERRSPAAPATDPATDLAHAP